MSKNEPCHSCGHELEPGLNECPGCGSMTPPHISLNPKSLARQAWLILLVIAIGLLLKLLLAG